MNTQITEVGSKDAAETLGVSVPTITRWVKSGYLKPIDRYGDHKTAAYRFRRSDIELLKESRS